MGRRGDWETGRSMGFKNGKPQLKTATLKLKSKSHQDQGCALLILGLGLRKRGKIEGDV